MTRASRIKHVLALALVLALPIAIRGSVTNLARAASAAQIGKTLQVADVATGDGVVSGTVAFFTAATCPSGWQAAPYLQGSMPLGATTGWSGIGVMVGTPLGDQEDRTHTHEYVGDALVLTKQVAGADGSNTSAAAAGSVSVMGTSDPATSGLPFIQMLACEKQ